MYKKLEKRGFYVRIMSVSWESLLYKPLHYKNFNEVISSTQGERDELLFSGELLKRLKRYAWKVYRRLKPCMGSNPIFSISHILLRLRCLCRRKICLNILSSKQNNSELLFFNIKSLIYSSLGYSREFFLFYNAMNLLQGEKF